MTKRFLWPGIPLLNTFFQIFIKLAAEHAQGFGSINEWLARVMTAPWMLAAIATEIMCFILWMQVLSEFDLSKAFPLSAISYVLVLASSWLLFGEEISALRLLGSALILGGVWLIGTASLQKVKQEGKSRQIDLVTRSHNASSPLT